MRVGLAIVILLAVGAWFLGFDQSNSREVPVRSIEIGGDLDASGDGQGVGETETARFRDEGKVDAVVISRAQALLLSRVRGLLGEDIPGALSGVALEPAAVERLGDRVEREASALIEAGNRFRKRARERAEEIFEAHGYREWEARRIRVPDPQAPGRMVERLSTPYDDQRDDEFILAKGVPHPDRRLRHVVRLVPERDSKYAVIHRERMAEEADIRERLRRWLLEQL